MTPRTGRSARSSVPTSPTPQVADRITVALVAKAAADLEMIKDRTGLSKTDIVNRAIALYEFFDAEMRNGRELFIRDRETGQTQLIKLL